MVIKVKVRVEGLENVENAVMEVSRKKFDEWKKFVLKRMQQMSDEINGEYGALGQGGLADATTVQEGPGRIELKTDTMVLIYLEWGTRAHGPVTANMLHFFIDGVEIFTKWVQGVRAHNIVQRAVERFIADMNQSYQG